MFIKNSIRTCFLLCIAIGTLNSFVLRKLHETPSESSLKSSEKSILDRKPLGCDQFSSLIECFAYNLFINNNEKLHDMDPESKKKKKFS